MASKSLVLRAQLLGKGSTGDDKLQVTLKIGASVLQLLLKPDEVGIFPDLVEQAGGGHPLFDPRKITYATGVPEYDVTISQVVPVPVPVVKAAVAAPVAQKGQVWKLVNGKPELVPVVPVKHQAVQPEPAKAAAPKKG